VVDLEETKEKLRGPSILGVTIFNDSYELNIEALKENIRFSMDSGISDGKGFIICPCGGGEYVTLCHEEHKMLVEAAREVAGNKLLVIAGVSSCDYREAIELANNAAEAGAKCIMLSPPYYYPLSQEDVYRWYKIIAGEIEIGIMAYDQPWNEYVGGFISVPLFSKLAEIENVISIKYSSTVLKDYITALSLYSKRFAFIDNAGTYKAIVAQIHGKATGYITQAGSFWPEYEAKYWSLVEQGKYEEATEWESKINPLWEFVHSEGPFIEASVAKAVLEYRGLHGGPVRPPFMGLTKEQKEKFSVVLEAIGIPKKK